MSAPLLELSHVSKRFTTGGLLSRRTVTAVDDVGFTIAAERPEIFAIVGESGSGKSTMAKMILGLEVADHGSVRFGGADVAGMKGRAARAAFMRKVQPVFQNPFEAFNPLTRIDRYLLATASNLGGAKGRTGVRDMADAALHRVGLSFAEIAGRFPHELSGGQLQRVAVARALISEPRLIVADEPVSMVDASLRMAIVNVFRALRDELGITIVYITHDLATTYYIADRLIVMHKGRVVESGVARDVLDQPQHEYSAMLCKAALPPDPASASAIIGARMRARTAAMAQ